MHPGAPLLTTRCGATMSCPLASDPGWGHGQSQEECERQSEECGSVLRPRTFLVVSLGAQGDGAPWPVLVTLCVAGKLQPPAVTPGEDATLFRVEAGEDGKAQADRDMVRIRRVYQLLAEDIILDVEVVPDEEQQQGSSLELEEKTVEEQCQERPGGTSELPALDVLQALATLQVELSSEPEKTCRAYVWFMCKSQERRKRDLAQGSTIIQGIPGFWAKVVSFLLLLGVCCSGGGGGAEARAQDGCWWTLKKVWYWGKLQRHSMWHKWLLNLKQIMNHPEVSVLISDQDKDFLSYMIDLNVSSGASHPRSCSKLIFSFRDRLYFLKTVIIKEYYLDITGKTVSQAPNMLRWKWLQAALGKYGRVCGEPQGQDMVHTVAISDIAGLSRLHLLCSPFEFVSPC
ncbi:hypothetical protein MG293_020834 [Ovis ammon polii]|uniref:Uncharacterized protein n=1 Tax=Ovis ammon polii TaxID=230172 RepID=A0AAD4TPA3_OVIAM|nr:hypothetical protein MG293_020834 [Ovis ammon polii]